MRPTDGYRGDEHTDSGETHHYYRDTLKPCSQAVVTAVADTLCRSPLDLEPLYHRVNPEALDDLVDHSLASTTSEPGSLNSEPPSVRFRFAGCRVAVTPLEIRVVTETGEE